MKPKGKLGDFYLDEINGYFIECVRGHPLFPGRKWVAQHRRVMAEKLGRPLKSTELVHHKDENKLNNDPENLELTTRAGHPAHHAGATRSEETKKRMSAAAKARCTPEWRAEVSERVVAQHKAGKFGRQTWKEK